MTTELKALESYTRDVGRNVARIDYDMMDKLQLSTGNIVCLTSKTKKTWSRLLQLYPSDEGKSILRIDGLTRLNLGASIGDPIEITKSASKPALNVILKSLEAIPPIDERYLADVLEQIVVAVGDHVYIPYFGGKLKFNVIETIPEHPVIVTPQTVFKITDNDYKAEEQKKSNTFIRAGLIAALQAELVYTDAKDLQNIVDKYKPLLDSL